MRKYLGNPRLCGWRMLNGEVVRNADGYPVVGEWEPICTTDEWLAINARLESRRGQRFDGKGKPLGPLHRDWSETKYLLTGVARCGKPHEDRGVCMAPMRGAQQKDCKSHSYLCPTPTNGGCAGTGRNGARLEAYVIEAVLARAEAETMKRADVGEWEGEGQLHALTERRNAMSKAFAAGAVSPEVAFDTETGLPFFEAQIKALRAERERHAAKRAEAQAMPANVRAEWEARADDLSWRRAFVRKWLHSVVVFPVPRGTKVWRNDSARLIWRES
jgi:hypothetical protein